MYCTAPSARLLTQSTVFDVFNILELTDFPLTPVLSQHLHVPPTLAGPFLLRLQSDRYGRNEGRRAQKRAHGVEYKKLLHGHAGHTGQGRCPDVQPRNALRKCERLWTA